MTANKNSTGRSSRSGQYEVVERRDRGVGATITTYGRDPFPPKGGGDMEVRDGTIAATVVVDTNKVLVSSARRVPGKRPTTDLAALDRRVPEPDDEAPEFTPEQIAAGDPHNEVAGVRVNKGGRPKLDVTKEQITLRLSPEVIAHFRETGAGWQTRIDEALKRVVKRARR